MAGRVEGAELGRTGARRRWTEAMAAEVVGGAARSGQKLSEYCRDRGLKYERVRRWQQRLGEKSVGTKRPLFMPVHVEPAVQRGLSPAESTAAGVLELAVGGCVVRTRGEVSETMLLRAIRAAKEAARC